MTMSNRHFTFVKSISTVMLIIVLLLGLNCHLSSSSWNKNLNPDDTDTDTETDNIGNVNLRDDTNHDYHLDYDYDYDWVESSNRNRMNRNVNANASSSSSSSTSSASWSVSRKTNVQDSPSTESTSTSPKANNNDNTNTNSNNNQFRWDHNHNHMTNLPPAPSNNVRPLLIVQNSPGLANPELVILTATSKLNRAYAKRKGFDYLKFTGNALGNDVTWEATFNEPYLLNYLIQSKTTASSSSSSSSGMTDTAANPYQPISQLYQLAQNDPSNTNPNNNNNNIDASSSDSSSTTTTTSDSSTTTNIATYDVVMFIDAGAMIAQLDYNVLDLLPNGKLLARSPYLPHPDSNTANNIHNGISNNNSNNNNNNNHNGQSLPLSTSQQHFPSSSGSISTSDRQPIVSVEGHSNVMIWNLNHPLVKSIANEWFEKSKQYIQSTDAVTPIHSQKILHDVLAQYYTTPQEDSNLSNDLIEIIPERLVFGLQGSIIKQDELFFDDLVIEENDLYEVMPMIQGIVDSVCYRFYPQCELV